MAYQLKHCPGWNASQSGGSALQGTAPRTVDKDFWEIRIQLYGCAQTAHCRMKIEICCLFLIIQTSLKITTKQLAHFSKVLYCAS